MGLALALELSVLALPLALALDLVFELVEAVQLMMFEFGDEEAGLL